MSYTNSESVFFHIRSPEAVIPELYDILTSYQACRFPLAFCITVVGTQFNLKISKMAAGVIAITSTFHAGKAGKKERACMQAPSALLSPLGVCLKVRLIPTYLWDLLALGNRKECYKMSSFIWAHHYPK